MIILMLPRRFLEGPFFRNTPSTAGNSMTGSREALSGTTSEKRGVPSRTGGEIILEMLWKPQMP